MKISTLNFFKKINRW